VKAHRRQSGSFSLRLLFVSAVRLGAVVIDLGFFVKAESFSFFLDDLGNLISLAVLSEW